MAGREILNKMKEKVGLGSSADSGKGKSKISNNVTHGYHLVKGKSHQAMEDYIVAQFKQVDDYELGLFAIFDGHLSHVIPDYLRLNLFDNILKEMLVVANVGDSRAVICKNGVAKQLSVDHEPSVERKDIEKRGGFVSNFPGDVPRVDGQLAVARAFGDKSLKEHLSSEPDVAKEVIDDDTDFIILASDGLWKVMSNQEAADAIKNIKDARSAAKHLAEEALNRKSKDDISCIVVKFQ
ncbi:hypothetical protein GH714_009905 [Hevea brasiliensis]|uniref:PPM-type phosphatase domain-containing protein n=1 Tax=Hevea brasiliensis TaxID=3981 RepID=A0A6A6KCH2_HEVBR|nr:hypothetical protein GH714_009905 [Hevea brasiliensis]